MGIFNRRSDRVLREGVEGTATILESEVLEPGYTPGENRYSTWDEVSRAFDLGRQPYRFRLQIKTGVLAPFEIEGSFKVPRRAESPSRFKQGRLRQGLELPVRVDPSEQTHVEIDWDRFMADPGRKEALRKNYEDAVERTMRNKYKHLTDEPDDGEKLSEKPD